MAFGKKFWRRTFTVVKIVGKVFLVAAAADRIKIKPSERIIIECDRSAFHVPHHRALRLIVSRDLAA